MTQSDLSANEGQLATPRITTRRNRLSAIWIVPFIAASIALYLGWISISERGPQITLTLPTAEGIEAGKTQIRYKAINFGTVTNVALSPDGHHVMVTAGMTKQAAALLHKRSLFWVVRPRISANTGISGLSTIVSGVYIEFDPGPGDDFSDTFVVLDTPPVIATDAEGSEFTLETSKIGSVGAGSPIFYRGLQVGQVLGYDSSNLEEGIRLRVFIRAPHDKQVRRNTRFWNDSGISLSTGPLGFRVQLDSIQALLAGGIAFDTLGSTTQEEQAKAGATFPLFENQASADEARYNIRLKYLVYFDSSVGGLAPGSNVEWHGLKIGRVVDVKLQYDVTRNVLRAPVLIEIEPERAQLIGVSGSADPAGALKTAVSRGLRAQLKTSNYLTGQSVVALELDPNAKKENLGTGDLYPVIPTDPNEFDSTLRSVNGILDRISKLPFDEVIGQTERTLKSLQELADAPEIKQSLNMLAATLKSTSDLINQSKADLEPALREVKPTLVSAEKAMKRIEKSLDSFEQGYGKSSSFKRDIARLFVQINDTMHSMQMIADYLEQHPESLIRGKSTGTK